MSNLTPQYKPTLRRKEVMEHRLEGHTKKEIWEWWCAKYNKTLHTFEKDLTWVNKQLSSFVVTEGKDVIVEHLIKYDHIYKISLEFGQLSVANQALVNKEKLLKLHAPDAATFVQNNSYSFDNLSLEEAKQLLLEAKKDDDK